MANVTTTKIMNLTTHPFTTEILNLTTHLMTTGMTNVTTPWQSTTETLSTDTTGTDIPSTAAPKEEISELWGFIAAGVAILFYGSNFVPIKKFETGDGVFFQWIVCSAVMISGIVVQLIRHQPPFFPLAMVGGVIWEFGNICVVPIVKTVGLGLGMCIWGMINLLSGWSTGRFGLFGVNASVPDKEVMNYIGVALCVCSAAVFAMIKNEIIPIQNTESEPLIAKASSSLNNEEMDEEESFIDRLSPGMKRVVGIVLCIFSGLLYGQMFTGATYIQDHVSDYHGAKPNGLDYVFSCFCGIYLTSTVFFCIYIVIMKNKPKIYPEAILPGIISGIMWSVATSCWFLANRSLSIPVAFPIITTGPSIIASLWGTVVFKEIKGRKNLLILFLGFAIAITGAVLAGVSKG